MKTWTTRATVTVKRKLRLPPPVIISFAQPAPVTMSRLTKTTTKENKNEVVCPRVKGHMPA